MIAVINFFMLYPLIPTKVHGILDYVYAAILIILPWVFGFSIYTYAPWVMMVIGVCIIIFSLLTRYESGYVGLISMRMHLWLDILAGVILIAAPSFLNFEHYITLPHQIMGAIAIVVALLSNPKASSSPTPRLKSESAHVD